MEIHFRVGQTLQKAKRRMEDQLNKIGLGKGKKKESLDETPGCCKWMKCFRERELIIRDYNAHPLQISAVETLWTSAKPPGNPNSLY